MELFLLDGVFRRIEHIDGLDSLVWAERASSSGDYTLRVKHTKERAEAYKYYRFIENSESSRIMAIESILDYRDDEDNRWLELSGPSIEKFVLDSRSVRSFIPGNKTHLIRSAKTTSGQAVNILMRRFANEEATSSFDRIYNLVVEPYLDPDLDARPRYYRAIEPKSLYEAVKALCDTNDLTFRMWIQMRESKEINMHFQVSWPRDMKHLVFGRFNDSLSKERHLSSMAGYKNVAMVQAKDNLARETVTRTPAQATGVDRHTIFVDASDIDPKNTSEPMTADEVTDILKARGTEALAAARKKYLSEGEVPAYSPYKYGRDYELGDLVSLVHSNGTITVSQVTEYIWTYDRQGLRSFPTITQLDES